MFKSVAAPRGGIFWVLVLTLALVSANRMAAAQPAAEPPQTPPAKVEPPVTAADFERIHAEWRALERQLENLKQNYRDAFTLDKREEILNEYQRLATDSQNVLPKLQAAAAAAVAADSAAANQEPGRTLLGFAAQDFRRDRYEAALERATHLEAQGCKLAGLHNLLGLLYYHLDQFDKAEPYLNQAQTDQTLSEEGLGYHEDLATAKQLWAEEQAIRQREAEADDLPRVKLVTSKGEIVLELYENEAPETVGNFISLVESGFYKNSPFHRVLGNFMAQGGSNTDDGTGGPGYTIYCECTKPEHRKHFRGSLSMAKTAEINTGNSQFFLTFRRTSHLDGKHTVFGRVVSGLELLPEITRRDPTRPSQPAADRILSAEVVRKRDHAYAPHKVTPASP